MSMKPNEVTFVIRLPKGVRIANTDAKSIPIDDTWRCEIMEGHRRIGEMSYGVAKRKFGTR